MDNTIFIMPFTLVVIILALFAWTVHGEYQVRHPPGKHRK